MADDSSKPIWDRKRSNWPKWKFWWRMYIGMFVGLFFAALIFVFLPFGVLRLYLAGFVFAGVSAAVERVLTARYPPKNRTVA